MSLSGRRVMVVARRVLRQRLRDRHTLVILVLQPLVIMAIFGYAFGGDVTDARVGVASLDRGPLAGKVLDHLDREVVTVVLYETEAQVEGAVRRQDVRVGVVFPTNFSRNLESGVSTAYVIVFEDNTNPQVTGAVLEEVLDALADTLEDEFDREGGFELEERPVFGGEDGETLEFFLPGVVAFAIFMLGMFLTSVTLVQERVNGTLDRILASPVRRAEVVLGFLGAFGLFALFQAIVVLSVATAVFRVPVRGPILVALVVTTLVGVVALGFGILVSARATSEFQAIQSVSFFAFPSMFLAGVFVPFESMPPIVRPFSRLIPLTYAVTALRAIINHGAGLRDVLPQVLVLGAFGAGFVVLGSLSFGRRKGG